MNIVHGQAAASPSERRAAAQLCDTEDRIAALLSRLAPAVAGPLREARSQLQAQFARGYELVYDTPTALVFAIASGPRSAQTLLSIAGQARRVTLFFAHGEGLDDPQRLLHGEPGTLRRMTLAGGGDLARPAVRALIEQAVAPHAQALRRAPPLTTLLKAQTKADRTSAG